MLSPLEEEFLAFHKAHPEVYEVFCKEVRELLERGYTRYSMRAIMNATHLHMDKNRKLYPRKPRDALSPYYARLWLKDNPYHPKFFKLLTLKAKGSKRSEIVGHAT